MACRWTSWNSQRTSKSPEKHNLLSIILEKMLWLLPLPKCYTKHQFSSHFPFHKQTWIFFLAVFSSQSKWFLRDPVNYLFPLSQAIISLLHLGLTSWAQFPSTYNYVKTCQDLRSGGLKGAQIWGEEAAGLSDTELPFTARQLTPGEEAAALQVI